MVIYSLNLKLFMSTTIIQITLKLDLRKNDLQELARGAFQHTPYLTHLNLQGSNIRSVREGAFRGLGRLVHLNLAHNNIDVLYQVGDMHLTLLNHCSLYCFALIHTMLTLKSQGSISIH